MYASQIEMEAAQKRQVLLERQQAEEQEKQRLSRARAALREEMLGQAVASVEVCCR